MSTIKEDQIKDISIRLKEYLENDQNVYFGFIFGSFVRRRLNQHSDIDVAIYFKLPPEGLNLLKLINTLSEYIRKDVDLIVLNRASAFLRHQVMKYGIPLAIKDRVGYQRFREKTISDFEEYKFVSGMDLYDR